MVPLNPSDYLRFQSLLVCVMPTAVNPHLPRFPAYVNAFATGLCVMRFQLNSGCTQPDPASLAKSILQGLELSGNRTTRYPAANRLTNARKCVKRAVRSS